MTIEEHWEEIGKPQYLYDPELIEAFLLKLIHLTHGSVNIDSIHNYGSSDSLTKIERDGSLFQLYWKDFKKEVDRIYSSEASEDEKTNLACFDNFTYIYYLMNIHKLEIRVIEHCGLFVIVYGNFMSQKKSIKFLKRKYKFVDCDVQNDLSPTRKNVVFVEGGKYKHECLIDVLPISNMIIFQKLKPWSEHTSHRILKQTTIIDLVMPIIDHAESVESLKDENETEIRRLINDIRYSVEGLLKFYYISRTISNSMNFKDNAEFDKIIKMLTEKYGAVTIGDLKKKLDVDNMLPQKFVNVLNEYSHYSGTFPNLKILENCYICYYQLLGDLFDLESLGLSVLQVLKNN